MTLRPTHHDNRGSMSHPFGYVYFTDGTRTAYAVVPAGPDVFGDGEYNLFTDWEPQDDTHLALAEEYLHSVFGERPEWYTQNVS